jgi:hypothetical protein
MKEKGDGGADDWSAYKIRANELRQQAAAGGEQVDP